VSYALALVHHPLHLHTVRAVPQITQLLLASRSGDGAAFDRLFDALYEDLRRLAHSRLRRSGETMLDTGALVHEAYLRLFRTGQLQSTDRQHFLAYAARVMRSIVIDFARCRSADRRGGGAEHVTLEVEALSVIDPRDAEIIRMQEALAALEQIDYRLAEIVEMRYFAGLTEKEVADALNCSVRSVARGWEKARLFLAVTLDG
jgi:RNA polymerase sigma factor (TIGR02999 family)